MSPEPDELHLTLCDALSGWRYIRDNHGDLYGVGWERVQRRLQAQIEASAERLKSASSSRSEEVARLREALQVCHDELLSLNKTIDWGDGEWHSIQVARSALKEN
jgi:hypothetical protein